MKVDLHIHSIYTDGSKTSKEIFTMAKDKGLDLISITDHDTLKGIGENRDNGEKYHIGYIPGLEISGYDYKRNKPCHIVGLGIEENNLILNRLIEKTRQARQTISLKQIEILKSLGYDIHIENFSNFRVENGIYKQHIMENLIEKGYAREYYGDFYKRNFKNNGPLDFSIEYVPHIEAVKAICGAGGKAILAHPSIYDNFDAVEELVEAGLYGLECFYPLANENIREKIKSIGKKFNLFLSGGSDFHGKYANETASMIGETYLDTGNKDLDLFNETMPLKNALK